MLTPSQQFQEAKQELITLHSEYITALRKEHNTHVITTSKRIDDLDALINFKVEQRMKVHLELVQQAIQRIEATLRKHLGTI